MEYGYRIRHKGTGRYFIPKYCVNPENWVKNKTTAVGKLYQRKPCLKSSLSAGLSSNYTKIEDWEIVKYELIEVRNVILKKKKNRSCILQLK